MESWDKSDFIHNKTIIVIFVVDLNVEHAQMLIYLFHSLTLMQKKSVLLMTGNAIVKVSNILCILFNS